MRRIVVLSGLLLFLLFITGFAADQAPSQLMEKMIAKAKENDHLIDEYGFYQKSVTRLMDSDGNLKKEEVKVYKTVWIENKPFSALQTVNGKALNQDQQQDEVKRREKFIEAIHNNTKSDATAQIDLKWEELVNKYNYTMISSDTSAPYVLDFQPKNGDLPERSKVERIFNNLAGRIWMDHDCNLLKAETRLVQSVKFGLGVIAKVDKLDIAYQQGEYERVYLPSMLNVKFKARVALFKSMYQEVENSFSDFFHKPQS